MSTLVVAIILIAVVIAICFLLVSVEQKTKRKAMYKLRNRLSRLGSDLNLSFSSQELFKHGAIGLDGVHRQLLVISHDERKPPPFVLIDLNKVKSCSVRKQYGAIHNGDLKRNTLGQYLQNISLHFEMENGEPPADVFFFDHNENHVYEITGLEEKAKHWETVISKMQIPSKKRA